MQHVSAAFVAGALPRGSPSTRGEAAEALSFDALPTVDQLYPPPFPAKRRHIRAVSPRAASALQRDLEAPPDGLERAAAALCSPQREIVLLTSNLLQLEIAALALAVAVLQLGFCALCFCGRRAPPRAEGSARASAAKAAGERASRARAKAD